MQSSMTIPASRMATLIRTARLSASVSVLVKRRSVRSPLSLFLVEQLSRAPLPQGPGKAKLDPSFEDLGERKVKNIIEPILK